jgi:predicted nucleotidyltransferase
MTTSGTEQKGHHAASAPIESVLRQIDEPANTIALLVYGSYARGTADPHSDLDVIRIQRCGPQAQFYRWIEGIEVDVYSDTAAAIRRLLYARAKDNNNFLLNALVNSAICMDREECGAALVQEAKALWERGPEPVPEREKEIRCASLLRLLNSTRHLVVRAGNSQEARLFAEMRLGDLFKNAVYSYMCLARRWTSSLRETVSWIRASDHELARKCDEFIQAKSLECRLAAAQEIVAAACMPALDSRLRGNDNALGACPEYCHSREGGNPPLGSSLVA